MAKIEQTLPDLILQIDDLPEDARKIITDRHKRVRNPQPKKPESPNADWRAELVEVLKNIDQSHTGDDPLSWQTLGELIDDFQFQQVISLLDFYRTKLAVDTTDSLRVLRPLVQHHPLADMIDCYDMNVEHAQAAAAKLLPIIQSYDFSLGGFVIKDIVPVARQLEVAGTRMGMQIDAVVPDLLTQMSFHPDNLPFVYPILQPLAPDCPRVLAATLSLNWAEIEPVAVEWEQKNAHHFMVLKELTQKYADSNRLEDARRTATRWTEMNPESESFQYLSEVCRRLDDWEGQQQALKEIVKLPALGLERAGAAAALADGYMRRQEWEEAKPYAEIAASSYSGWGLVCAVNVYEGLRLWEEAELVARACSERYEDSADFWYLWCRRTGHGDAASALKLAEAKLKRPTNERPDWIQTQQAFLHYLEGDLAAAYKLIAKTANQTKGDYDTMLAAIFAHQLGKTKECESWFQKVADSTVSSPYALLARYYFRKQREEAWSPDDAELEWLVTIDLSPGKPSNSMYFLSHILRMQGDPRSTTWLERCAATPINDLFLRTLAGWELTQAGHESPLRRGTELNADDVRAAELLLQAQQLRQQGQGDLALMKCREAMATRPQFLQAQTFFATSMTQMGMLREAERAWTELMPVLPSFSHLYFECGRIHELMLQPQLAIRDYEAGLKVWPRDKALHHQLAWMFLADPDSSYRDIPRGLKHGEQALGRGPGFRYEDRCLQAAMAAVQGKFDDAAKDMDAAIALVPPQNRYLLTVRRDGYQQKQLYTRPPAGLPLIETLPDDGTWVQYDLDFTITPNSTNDGNAKAARQKPENHHVEVTLRSVGRLTRESGTLRYLEIEVTGDSEIIPATIYRLVVPESAFGRFHHPLLQAVKMWVGPRNGTMLARDAIDDDPMFLFLMTGATDSIFEFPEPQEFETPLGTFPGESYLGKSTSANPNLGEVGWSVARNQKIPFGMVFASFNVLNEYQTIEAELKLKQHGQDAKPAYPDLLPE
ncbi:hypothetical protein GC163_16055 [bacterium]|nr:hypothetical protein [bacterium]